jgi:fructose-1,6-bisphosphatase/inositol monophosphatase family enzyme
MIKKMNTLETQLQFAIAVAREAGEIMRMYFHSQDKGTETKQDNSPVTLADKAVNQMLIDRVREAFPDHGVLGEEQSYQADRKELWVCDPIDGTVGFILGVPTAMFSLAYVVDGEPQAAVMYEPLLDKLFTAAKGQGAFLNGRPIHVNDRPSLDGASVGITASARQMLQRERFCNAMLDDGAQLLTIPGNVFKGALVAQGRLDAYIFPGRSAHDIAAEKLIIEEAGGKVTDIDGNEQRYDRAIRGAIISNGKLHDVLVKHLADYGAEDYLGY